MLVLQQALRQEQLEVLFLELVARVRMVGFKVLRVGQQIHYTGLDCAEYWLF